MEGTKGGGDARAHLRTHARHIYVVLYMGSLSPCPPPLSSTLPLRPPPPFARAARRHGGGQGDRPVGAMAAAREIVPFLEKLGLATEEVQEWLSREEVEFVDDLAHSFRSAERVNAEASFMLEAWMAASGSKIEAWKRESDITAARKQLREAGLAIQAVAAVTMGPRSGFKGTRKLTGKPRPKPLAKAKTVDKKARVAAAKAAVDLSLTWAPRSGIGLGLPHDDPIIKGMWAALNNWKNWTERMHVLPVQALIRHEACEWRGVCCPSRPCGQRPGGEHR